MPKRSAKPSNGDRLEGANAPAAGRAESPAQALSTEQQIVELAHRLWVERGCPLGSPEEDWFHAEHELQLVRHLSEVPVPQKK